MIHSAAMGLASALGFVRMGLAYLFSPPAPRIKCPQEHNIDLSSFTFYQVLPERRLTGVVMPFGPIPVMGVPVMLTVTIYGE